MEVHDEEFADAAEMAAAEDPAVGAGTPETAPHEIAFDDDDELEADPQDGAAEDDDDLDGDDDDTPLDETI